MAKYKEAFQRIEVKYLLNETQYSELMKRLEPMMVLDHFGKTTILNLYFDTPDFSLIEKSLEKPVYKEKLRLRTYKTAEDDTEAFIEIKKKFRGVVYKRRVSMPYSEAVDYLINGKEIEEKSQILKEIDYFLKYYKRIVPAMAISYDRIPMVGIKDQDLRITFDTNIRWRIDNLSLSEGNVGKDILAPGQHLMEIKFKGAIPLEVSGLLDELGIRAVSFSKYGRGYLDYMYGMTNDMIMTGEVPDEKLA